MEKNLDEFEEDIDYLFHKMDGVEDQIENINGVLYDKQAETAEYIRDLTEKKYKAYQKLLEASNGDTTQKEIAEELDIDEAVLSRFKKDFKDNNIL
jgi:DNA-directed RNA polymerase specialized sigma subunit